MIRGGSGSAVTWKKIDDTEPPLRLQRPRNILQQAYDLRRVSGFVHLVKRVDDDSGVDTGGQPRIGRRAEHRPHVGKILALNALADRLEHLALNVLGVNDAVRPDATSEAQREPSARGAELRDGRSVGDAEFIHDQFGLVPLIAIGRLEEAQIFWVEEFAPRSLLRVEAR